ncbi:FadR/GntR family transcriptional regulator [Jannaschia sp. LMIT008]|uniref:FadR/GntR family transcriptional regulator n=1 Tax=Jannaschia maritima TaxID=3032585 RepID=UPI002810ED3D|nr:FCD domain-containing protein [Jannaschia sp. LMIT008]
MPSKQPVAQIDGMSRVERVVDAVQARIRADGLRPGDQVAGEAEFAVACGVSRPVAREAFRSLAALGILDVGNGRRARVGPIDSAVQARLIGHAVTTDQITLPQIYDVRRTLEHRIAALAARLAHPAERAALVEHADAMDQANGAGDADAVRDHDLAFHTTLARATRNPMFALSVEGFMEVTRRTWRIAWDARADDAERLDSVRVHQAIARAVRDGDPGSASAAMDLHFDHSVRALDRAGVR